MNVPRLLHPALYLALARPLTPGITEGPQRLLYLRGTASCLVITSMRSSWVAAESPFPSDIPLSPGSACRGFGERRPCLQQQQAFWPRAALAPGSSPDRMNSPSPSLRPVWAAAQVDKPKLTHFLALEGSQELLRKVPKWQRRQVRPWMGRSLPGAAGKGPLFQLRRPLLSEAPQNPSHTEQGGATWGIWRRSCIPQRAPVPFGDRQVAPNDTAEYAAGEGGQRGRGERRPTPADPAPTEGTQSFNPRLPPDLRVANHSEALPQLLLPLAALLPPQPPIPSPPPLYIYLAQGFSWDLTQLR